MATSPCTLQVILSHFADVELTTQAKKEARPIVKELTGIDHYDAHAEQLDAIYKQIFNISYPEMKARISKLSSNPDDLPSTDFVKLLIFLSLQMINGYQKLINASWQMGRNRKAI